MNKPNIIHKELTYIVRGVLFQVYNQLGPKLPENLYQKAVTYGLIEQGITCKSEKQFEVIYRNESSGTYYIDHWIENGKLILELKVKPEIMPIHKAQTISYLKLTNADLAIIANFGAKSLQIQRLPNFIREKTTDFQWQSKPISTDILYSTLTDTILKALLRVHFILGPGFIHRIYRRAMMIELQQQGIGYEQIRKIDYYYNNQYIGQQKTQIIKLENKILLGIFALRTIDDTMKIVMKARLKHLRIKVGILANFYGERLVVERVLNTG
jgi:GxxExxY protein